MAYTYLQLFLFFLCYGILGWCAETACMAVIARRLVNRGFFTLPICPKYGVMMIILIIALPTLRGHYFLQFLLTLTVVSATDYFAGFLSKRIWRKSLWPYERNTVFGGEIRGSLLAIAKAVTAYLTVLLLHPFLFLTISLLPVLALQITAGVFLLAMAADFGMILYVVIKGRRKKDPEATAEIRQGQMAWKDRLGAKIYHAVWKRLNRAYPNMETAEASREGEYVFARGVCPDKLFWVFLVCAFFGDLIETVYCRMTMGRWMSRSSVIYGTFSLVWGMGAALLTVILQRLAVRDDRYVFLAGAVLGGVYEYTCSVFTEVFFGTTFWDYSKIPFNIGGRTNLLYCIFWGLLSVAWIKICYPVLSRWIEKIPPLLGKTATWVLILLLCCDALLSAAAMVRYVKRQAGDGAETVTEAFLDANYPDEMVEQVWPNMKIR